MGKFKSARITLSEEEAVYYSLCAQVMENKGEEVIANPESKNVVIESIFTKRGAQDTRNGQVLNHFIRVIEGLR